MLLLSAPGRQINGGRTLWKRAATNWVWTCWLPEHSTHTHTPIHKIKHFSVFMQICFHPTRFDPTACQHNQWKEPNLVSSLCHEAGRSPWYPQCPSTPTWDRGGSIWVPKSKQQISNYAHGKQAVNKTPQTFPEPVGCIHVSHIGRVLSAFCAGHMMKWEYGETFFEDAWKERLPGVRGTIPLYSSRMSGVLAWHAKTGFMVISPAFQSHLHFVIGAAHAMPLLSINATWSSVRQRSDSRHTMLGCFDFFQKRQGQRTSKSFPFLIGRRRCFQWWVSAKVLIVWPNYRPKCERKDGTGKRKEGLPPRHPRR